MNKKYLSHLSIATWNIHGIKSKELNKLDDTTFIDEIRKHHIIALQETHCTPDSFIHVDGYHTFQVNRPLSGNKAHGGLAFLVKNELRRGIRLISGSTCDTLWLCMKKDFFKTDKDIYLGTVYISPINSTYTQKLDHSMFEVIESELCKYMSEGQVILMGDFNSRTGASADYIVNDNVTHVQMPSLYIPDTDVLPRVSQDMKQCKYGSDLLEMCKTTGLKIANGRTLGDSIGQFTCHSWN